MKNVYDIYSLGGELVASVESDSITKAAASCSRHWPCVVRGDHIPNMELFVGDDGIPRVSKYPMKPAGTFKDSLPG